MKLDANVYQKIFDDFFIGIVLFDSKTFKSCYNNVAAETILGFGKSHFSFSDLVPEQIREGQRGLTLELLQMEGAFEDVFVKRSDGTCIVAHIQITRPLPGIFSFAIRDMTFLKKLQREVLTKQNELHHVVEQLQKQNEELRALDKAKDRFIALTSHELRTPISAVVATAQYIEDGLCNDEAEMKEHVKVMLDEGNHLLEMVNDILDFSKIQMGKLDLYVESKSLLELLQHDVHNMQKYAETKSITILLEERKDLPEIFCDPVRMAQVFYNVLSNAIKFSPDKTQVVISIDSTEVDKFIKISFKDAGMGIPKNQESKVFNEFETIENIQTHHKGTGLGMPICKRIMESMGGRIYFESAEGKGTTFFVEIPTQKVLAPEVYRRRSETGDLAA